MPNSNLDWLGVVTLWIGAVVMAIKTAGFPLIGAAPPWLASPAWGYVPVVLITVYLIIAFYRFANPVSRQAAPVQDVADNSNDRAHRNAIVTLQLAQTHARTALNQGTVVAAEQTLPEMKAALHTANKQFGIPIPPPARNPILHLETGRRLLDKVLPLLSQGHAEEAINEAEEFIAKVKEARASQAQA